MVKIYFETTKDGINADGRHAELVALFDNEDTYMTCLGSLEKEAKKANMIITESVEGISLEGVSKIIEVYNGL